MQENLIPKPGLIPKHMRLIHPNSPGVAKGRRRWRWGAGSGSENYFGSRNSRMLDERKYKSSGSKVLGHWGEKMAWRRKTQKKTSASSTSDGGEKKQEIHTQVHHCQAAWNENQHHLCGIFFLPRSLDQKDSSNAICSLCTALSAKGRRVHTLEHLFQEATWKIIL